jgi:acyl-CoA synthetase (AMP-forming)/AMP-acid ligase II
LAMGGRNVVAGKLDAEQLASLIAKKGVSIGMIPSPIDGIVTEAAIRDHLDLSCLRVNIGLAGGGPAHAEKMKQFCDRYRCRYLGIYGQTECTGSVTGILDQEYFVNPYTCGRPMKGLEVQIWDDENRPVPMGGVGEIMVRGKTTIPGYWRNDEGNKGLYTGDWLHTGDLGKVDEEGYLYFVDRKKELIKTGGENVYPKEVENILVEHPAILDLSVIGLPDPNGWGETVTVVIVPKPGLDVTIAEVKAFCKEKIAGYKIPKALYKVAEIPRNATGKVKKLELREKLAQSLPVAGQGS